MAARGLRTPRIACRSRTPAPPNTRPARDSKPAPAPHTPRRRQSCRRPLQRFHRRMSCGPPCKQAAIRNRQKRNADRKTSCRSKPGRPRHTLRTTPRRTCRAARRMFRRRHIGRQRNSRRCRTRWRHSTGYQALRTASPPACGHQFLESCRAAAPHRPGAGHPSDPRMPVKEGKPTATRPASISPAKVP
jgi:hypothetical protein